MTPLPAMPARIQASGQLRSTTRILSSWRATELHTTCVFSGWEAEDFVAAALTQHRQSAELMPASSLMFSANNLQQPDAS